MADSTLDMTGETEPVTTLGHGTSALGPSDSSDSGSDMTGGPGMDEGLTDEQSREMPMTIRQGAGRDIGDAALDSDSDRMGTGERASAGVQEGVANDQLTTQHPGVESGEDELDDPDATADTTDVADKASDRTGDDDLDDDLDDATVSDGAT